MTAGGGGSGKPPDWRDDPMQRPASDAGWDDERPTARSVPIAAPASATAAPPGSAPASSTPALPTAASRTGPPTPSGTAAPAAPATTASASSAAPSSPPPRGLSFPAYSPARAADAASPALPPSSEARPAVSSSATPAGAAATSPSAPAPHRDDPALPDIPDTYDANELRSAVGAAPLATSSERRATSSHDEDDDHGDEPRRRTPRSVLIAALGIAAVLGIAALVAAGYLNRDRYVLACEAERAVPEQGRGFPPWGTRALGGEPWRPLKIAPETRCQPQETDDPLALERAFLAMVLDQATALLTAREVTRVDEAEALLKQGLLLTRPPEHEPEPLARQRTEHHQEIERMLGDVTYWRATAKLREAAAALGDAAAQFDAAVAQHPRHVSDAGAWAAYTRKLAQELHAGPAGAPSAVSSAVPVDAPAPAPAGSAGVSEHPAAPAGIALPIEPDKASATPPPQAATPPDAGAPAGGVLL